MEVLRSQLEHAKARSTQMRENIAATGRKLTPPHNSDPEL
jgi:hypothetical protein